MSKECIKCGKPVNDISMIGVFICQACLREESNRKQNEWINLDIKNVPSDLFVGDYEFHEGDPEVNSFPELCKENAMTILGYMHSSNICHKFYYRKSYLKVPTHEEKAEDYIQETFPIDRPVARSPELYNLIQAARNAAYESFIAGRKSMTP